MGEDKDRAAETAAPQETPSTDPATGPRAPGHVPNPVERDWGAEPLDPFDGIDRRSPFEGRPETAVPGGGEELEAGGEPAGPGQPIPRREG